ncbi:MAG: 2-oxoacid:acceptor oxidoreductase subunit alpha, partial [Candidatus Omnitrophica bacterium]|nr:2-oxoacid:acceptor oxidoreductase subunit alpha [Candidatus Omnitrophota bacterium]
IRGGHTFSIIRASFNKIAAHQDKIDFLLALNQDTFDFHKSRLNDSSVVIYDSDNVKPGDLSPAIKTCGIPIGSIIKEESAPEIMRNACIIGAFCKAAGIKPEVLESVLKKEISRETDLNLKVAFRGFNAAGEFIKIDPLSQDKLPLITGSQAMGLGFARGGLQAYISYPMTPSSPLLHFLAEFAEDFSLKVIHPESEIGVILMSLGFAYMGKKTAVGTSGGGFCLMTEGLGLAGMAELPIVIVMGQRPGPSTGLPTYTSQADLHFVINAGQGEFVRFVVAPADAEEAFYWSAASLNISWKYQIPSVILVDKTLTEGVFSFDINCVGDIKEDNPSLWGKSPPYKRYLNTDNGVSALAFPGEKEAVVKANSYEHDEYGITSEDPGLAKMMQEKRLRKEKYLLEDLKNYNPVKVYGREDSKTALLCWGSNKGVCVEAARVLGLKVIQLQVLWPFPAEQFKQSLEGVNRLICVENNATGQLIKLIKMNGFNVNDKILKYDGRPFPLEELLGLLAQLNLES